MCCEMVLAHAFWKGLLGCAPVALYQSAHTQAMRGADLCRAPWLLTSLNNSCSLFLWAKVKCCSIKHVGYSAMEGVCNSSSCNCCRHVHLCEQHLHARDSLEAGGRVIKYRLQLKGPKEPLQASNRTSCAMQKTALINLFKLDHVYRTENLNVSVSYVNAP